MSQPSVKLAILIATKDRSDELRNLLESISRSTLLPDKIVIVYSGEDVSPIISQCQKKLNIQIIYSPIASQSIQKSLGIKSLSQDYNWVLFLDDDLVLELNTIKILFHEYLVNPKYDGYAGFGLGISNRSTRSLNMLVVVFLKFFRLSSGTPGIITKSGHAQSYLDHGTEVDVQWLNGVSAWNSKVLFNYPTNQTSISYSAYEDVEFSYKVGKTNKMLFVPRVKVLNQKIEGNSPLTVSQYVYGGYLRYKFVFTNHELSKSWLLIAQFIRGLDFILRPNRKLKILSRFKVALNLWLRLLILALRNKNSEKVLHDNKVENIK